MSSGMKVPICPQCGENMLGEQSASIGVSKSLQSGQTVPGSETFHGIFHPECWTKYKALHSL